MLTVSFIVHNDYDYIAGVLAGVLATQIETMIYVVINTPPDERTNQLRVQFPTVNYIQNAVPQGFAANHNQVLRLAQTPYVALLNDDIVLHDRALELLVDYLTQHPDVGLVGGQLLNPNGTLQVSVYSDPSLFRSIYKISGLAFLTHQNSRLRRWLLSAGVGRFFKDVESLQQPAKTPYDVPVVKGAVMVVRRLAYEAVGLMDETTQMYGEEIDWHWRLRQAGWRVVMVPTAHITHYGTGQASLRLHGQFLVQDRKAQLRYYYKHRPGWQSTLIRGVTIVSHSLWGLVWLLPNRQRARVHGSIVMMAMRGETSA